MRLPEAFPSQPSQHTLSRMPSTILKAVLGPKSDICRSKQGAGTSAFGSLAGRALGAGHAASAHHLCALCKPLRAV